MAGVSKRLKKKYAGVFWAGPADCAGSVGRILGGVSQDLILPDSQRSGTICLELGHGRIGKDLAVDLARRAPGKPGGGGSLRAFRRANDDSTINRKDERAMGRKQSKRSEHHSKMASKSIQNEPQGRATWAPGAPTWIPRDNETLSSQFWSGIVTEINREDAVQSNQK